jgi:hypothetical protein
VAPRPRVRSGRLLILAVLVVVAVVLPAGAALLDRRDPATRPEPRTPPPAASTAVQTYPPGTPAPALRLPGLEGGQVDLAASSPSCARPPPPTARTAWPWSAS